MIFYKDRRIFNDRFIDCLIHIVLADIKLSYLQVTSYNWQWASVILKLTAILRSFSCFERLEL
jgi:hypothetical protein